MAATVVPTEPTIVDAPTRDPAATVTVGGVAVPRYMTLAQFEDYQFEGSESVELVLGEIRAAPQVGGAHLLIMRTIFRALDAHVVARGLGEVFPDSAGYILTSLRDTMRGPDVSFVRAGKIPSPMPQRGMLRVVPDLAVEILSPNDRYVDVDERREQMFEAGTSCWWLVDPRRRRVEVHVPDALRRVLRKGEVLDGAPVLPDFALPVADAFAGVALER